MMSLMTHMAGTGYDPQGLASFNKKEPFIIYDVIDSLVVEGSNKTWPSSGRVGEARKLEAVDHFSVETRLHGSGISVETLRRGRVLT
jgi:hypothetical protein